MSLVYHLIYTLVIFYYIEDDWSSFTAKNPFLHRYFDNLLVVNSLMLLCDCVLSVLRFICSSKPKMFNASILILHIVQAIVTLKPNFQAGIFNAL